MSASGDLFRDIFMSLSRVFVGYITGVVFAITVGLFMGRSEVLRRSFPIRSSSSCASCRRRR